MSNRDKYREVWTKIASRAEADTYGFWVEVAAAVRTHGFPWFRVMDRVQDQGWKPFSPEVSGNSL